MTITLRTFIMAFGFLVTATGLLLFIFRNEQAQNRIKILGQEFEISTPALVVFLAGCALFVMPLFLNLENSEIRIGSTSSPSDVGPSRKGSESDKPATTLIPTEGEPNDQLTEPNVFKLGTRIRGTIATRQDRDFFKITTPFKTNTPGQPAVKLRTILRKTSEGFLADVAIYNHAEEFVAHQAQAGDTPVSFAFSISGPYFYVSVKPLLS
jgi:hypothetical protein